MKKNKLCFWVVLLVIVIGVLFFLSNRRIEGTYKIGDRGYAIIQESILRETGNSLLGYLAYKIASPVINDSIVLEARFTKNGTVTISNGVRYMTNVIDTTQYMYFIDMQGNVCITEDLKSLSYAKIGRMSKDRNTFYMYVDLDEVPLERY